MITWRKKPGENLPLGHDPTLFNKWHFYIPSRTDTAGRTMAFDYQGQIQKG